VVEDLALQNESVLAPPVLGAAALHQQRAALVPLVLPRVLEQTVLLQGWTHPIRSQFTIVITHPQQKTSSDDGRRRKEEGKKKKEPLRRFWHLIR
jgi:hypothetical protein